MPDLDFHVGVEHTFKNTLRNPIKDVDMMSNSIKNFLVLSILKDSKLEDLGLSVGDSMKFL